MAAQECEPDTPHTFRRPKDNLCRIGLGGRVEYRDPVDRAISKRRLS